MGHQCEESRDAFMVEQLQTLVKIKHFLLCGLHYYTSVIKTYRELLTVFRGTHFLAYKTAYMALHHILSTPPVPIFVSTSASAVCPSSVGDTAFRDILDRMSQNIELN